MEFHFDSLRHSVEGREKNLEVAFLVLDIKNEPLKRSFLKELNSGVMVDSVA